MQPDDSFAEPPSLMSLQIFRIPGILSMQVESYSIFVEIRQHPFFLYIDKTDCLQSRYKVDGFKIMSSGNIVPWD